MLTTRAELRRLLLGKQGLLGDRILAGAGGAVVWVRRQGFLPLELQTRALASSHDIALFDRVADYRAGDLDAVLYDGGQLFEHCLHVPGALPAADYDLIYDPEKAAAAARPGSIGSLLLAYLAAEGSATLRELQAALRARGYDDRRAVARAAHDLHACGAILIRRREGDERMYDLGDRILPRSSRGGLPLEERLRALARRTLHILAPVTRASLSQILNGIGSRARLGLLPMKREKVRLLADMLAEGEAVQVQVEDPPAWYLLPRDWLPALQDRPSTVAPRLFFLSPLDPVVWDRQRARDLFDYDWRRRLFAPETERRRFSPQGLLILYGQALVGRVEPQMSWASQRLIVHGVDLVDPSLAENHHFQQAFSTALQELATLHETHSVEVAGPLPFRLHL